LVERALHFVENVPPYLLMNFRKLLFVLVPLG